MSVWEQCNDRHSFHISFVSYYLRWCWWCGERHFYGRIEISGVCMCVRFERSMPWQIRALKKKKWSDFDVNAETMIVVDPTNDRRRNRCW